MLDAGLGRKEEAIREARRAVDLMPIAKDSLMGSEPRCRPGAGLRVDRRARPRARATRNCRDDPGDAPTTYGDLRFNPCWDYLRGDPRFDKIVAAAKAASR